MRLVAVFVLSGFGALLGVSLRRRQSVADSCSPAIECQHASTRRHPRIQDLSVSDMDRRRRWTDDKEIRIFEESHLEGVTLAVVVQRHEISRSMFYNWHDRHKLSLLGA